MQNDFCTKGGWVGSVGGDCRADRAPIGPLRSILPSVRAYGVPIVWVNWGNRPDLANMPPNQIHFYKPQGEGIGLGDPLPQGGAPVLQKDSWAAAVAKKCFGFVSNSRRVLEALARSPDGNAIDGPRPTRRRLGTPPWWRRASLRVPRSPARP